MGTRALTTFVAALALSGAGAAGCGDGEAPARAATSTPAPIAETATEFPEGAVTKSGAYRVKGVGRAEAERLCGLMRDDGWPDVYANHDEVRFSFPGPDLVCVPY